MKIIIKNIYSITGLTFGVVLFSISLLSKNFYLPGLFLIPILSFLIGLLYGQKKNLEKKYWQKKSEIRKMSGLSSIIKLSESIGHEFNNPLTIILGQVYLFRVLNHSFNKDDVCYKRFLIIENEARKLSNITEKFIALAKASSLFNYKPIEVNHLADRICNLKKEELRKANIDYTTKIENGAEIVDVDFNGVQEVCSQLFDNAIYFTKDVLNPKIIFNISAEKSKLIILIEDNGIGVEEKIRNEIFNPLFTTKPNHDGIGLGLFIAKKIAEAMNGSLTCLPRDNGAVFKLSL